MWSLGWSHGLVLCSKHSSYESVLTIPTWLHDQCSTKIPFRLRNELNKINQRFHIYLDKHQFESLLGRFTSDVETVSNIAHTFTK